MVHRRPRWQRRRPPAPKRDLGNGALIARINEISQLARAAWFSQLAYFVFVGITLLGVRDADFFIPERRTALPLVGVEIPTASFFWTAPVLGAALYTYLHLFLIKLWDAHGAARTSDADPTHHWLVNDFVLIRQGDPTARARPLSWLTGLVTVLLVWLAGPVVLAYAWLRSMPAHNEAMTLLIALCLGITLHVGRTSWSHADALIRARPIRRRRAATIPGAALLAGLSWFTTEGTLDNYVRTLNAPPDKVTGLGSAAHWTLSHALSAAGVIPVEEDRLGRNWSRAAAEQDKAWWSGTPFPALLVGADLRNVDFVDIPDGWRDPETARKAYRVTWCKDHGLAPEVCGQADPSQDDAPILAHRRDLWCQDQLPPAVADDPRALADRCRDRFARLDSEFTSDWTTERRAVLATLTRRDFLGHDFRKADLRGARLEGANLTSARLEEAALQEARLEGAVLWEAGLEGADLWEAGLEGAVLAGARLEGAGLDGTRLEGANLVLAGLEGANLWEARLAGADLSWVRLSASTVFRPATLRGAGLKAVDLSILTDLPPDFTARLGEAYGDGSVTLPSGLRPGEGPLAHWTPENLDYFDQFIPEWRAFQRKIGNTPSSR